LIKEGVDPTKTFFPDEEDDWLKVSPPHLSSPYGLLRSPWNYNPSKYTTRYNNVNRITNSDGSISRTGMWGLYLGSTCEDYAKFVESLPGQTLSVYLAGAEDQVHGNIHFAFGGAGGDISVETDAILRSEYNLTDYQLIGISRQAQIFFKTYAYPLTSETKVPVECTSNLNNASPTCTCHEGYFSTEHKFQSLVSAYFKTSNDATLLTYLANSNIDFEKRKRLMRLVCGRMQYDGDMGGSGAATDPLFWVAHGAIERLFQRIVFENILSSKEYGLYNGRNDQCSGHSLTGKKSWLQGFYFDGAGTDASQYTNVELTEILDPTTEKYRDYINYVYDDSQWSFCDGSESWFS